MRNKMNLFFSQIPIYLRFEMLVIKCVCKTGMYNMKKTQITRIK